MARPMCSGADTRLHFVDDRAETLLHIAAQPHVSRWTLYFADWCVAYTALLTTQICLAVGDHKCHQAGRTGQLPCHRRSTEALVQLGNWRKNTTNQED